VAELEAETVPAGYTVAGRLLGHQVLGRDLVRGASEEVPDLNPELLSLLEHILLTHLNPSEGVGPKLALVPEALIVHHADDLDLKMEAFARCLDRDQTQGPFTDRDPVLGRAVFKGRSV
jgi:3'-5' exoribonuclease